MKRFIEKGRNLPYCAELLEQLLLKEGILMKGHGVGIGFLGVLVGVLLAAVVLIGFLMYGGGQIGIKTATQIPAPMIPLPR